LHSASENPSDPGGRASDPAGANGKSDHQQQPGQDSVQMTASKAAPAFNKTMQIGIVVPDVEVAARAYEEQYGIGNWQIMEIGSENTEDVRLHGRPLEWKSKIAMTMVGSVMW
jgi:hypothetical protein